MMATEPNQTPYLAERLNELREIIGNEYMDERARRRLTAWLETTQKAAALSGGEAGVDDAMVRRFLAWPLPDDFRPDGGISFAPVGNAGTPHEYRNRPSGTNLLHFAQAKAMLEYVVGATTTPARVGVES